MRQARPLVMKVWDGGVRWVERVSAKERRSAFRDRMEGSGSCAGCARR